MIIIDFETNSSAVGDVVEVAILKVKRNENDKYEIVDTFHRYYHSAYSLNYHSLKVHNLTPEKIEELRNESDDFAPELFVDDYEFEAFCKDADNIVAHNLPFEIRHIDGRSEFVGHICTMRENKPIVKSLGVSGGIKLPKLNEVCAFYSIPFDEDSYHSAIFDVTMTLHIINAMPRDVLDKLIVK